jgi:phosphoenolpyruvate synthase/pyruvate phosphate dikinase
MADAPPRATAGSVLVTLDSPSSTDPTRTGAKAANLAQLLQAGFPVPPGAVVPADVADRAADELPDALVAELAGVAELIGPGPWAVRSSSVVEDAEQASYAGQFETVLNVDVQDLPR